MSDRCFYPDGEPIVQRDRVPAVSRDAAQALNRPHWAHVVVRVRQRGTNTQDGRSWRDSDVIATWREEIDGTGITQW